jgi:hypothetical protein
MFDLSHSPCDISMRIAGGYGKGHAFIPHARQFSTMPKQTILSPSPLKKCLPAEIDIGESIRLTRALEAHSA